MKSLARLACVTLLLLGSGLACRFSAEGAAGASSPAQIRQISEYQYVDKACRVFSNDKIGIDVDQTCVELRTAIGGTVVVPNPRNDIWMQEIADELGKPQARRDKWLARFYELGGGKIPGH